MSILRNLASGLITFFLVPLLTAYLIFNNFSGVLLNQDKFLGTLHDNNTYTTVSKDILPSVIVDNVSGNLSENGVPKEVVQNVVNSIDKDQLASDLEKTVGDVYRYSTGTTSDLNTVIDLTPYVKTLQTQLKPAFISYYQTLPACANGQNNNQQVVCQEKGVTPDQAANQANIDQVVSDLTTSIPKTITVTKNQLVFDPPLTTTNNQTKNDNNFSLDGARKVTSAAKPVNYGLLGTITFLFILLALVHLPKLTSILRALAWVIVSASVIPLIISGAFVYFIHEATIHDFLSSTLKLTSSSYEQKILDLVTSNAYSLGQKIAQGILLETIILVIVAGVMFGISFFWERRNKDSKEAEPNTASVEKEHSPVLIQN